MTPLEDKIKQEVMLILDGRDPSHDFEHIMRVYKNAHIIAKEEKGVDLGILRAAALLHDLVVHPKGSSIASKSADDSAAMAEKILLRYGYPKEKIDSICYCISTHSYSKGITPSTLEAKILQDADRLDALGAIGIARTFSVGGSECRAFYNPADPFCSSGRVPEDKRWTLDHFKAKLLKLETRMNTRSALKIAHERIKFMELFLIQLQNEIVTSENGNNNDVATAKTGV